MRAYAQGRWQQLSSARVPVDDRALLFGDSLFETIKIEDDVSLFAAQHQRRLLASAATMAYPVRAVGRLWQRVMARRPPVRGDAALRIAISAGPGVLLGARVVAPRAFAVLRPLERVRTLEPLALWLSEVRRPDARWLDSAAKHGNYLGPALLLKAAQARGFDEAIVLNAAGRPAELCSANLFIQLGRRLITPPLGEQVLPGITRAQVIAAAADAGVDVDEAPLSVRQLARARAVLCTSSLRGIRFAARIDQRKLPRPDPLVEAVFAAYRARVERQKR